MLAFHGSPNYFSKFSPDKIGTARYSNDIHGYYFTENIRTGYNFLSRVYISRVKQAAFLDDGCNNSTGYLYACDIPDKDQLLDLRKRLCEQSKEVQDIVYRVIHLDGFSRLFRLDMEMTGSELLTYLRFWQIKYFYRKDTKVVSDILSKQGLKGVIYYPSEVDNIQEIVIFNADDIKINQCFRIDRVPQDENNLHADEFDFVTVLFKRFGEYYMAAGFMVNREAEVVYFHTDDDCPEILDEIQTLDDLNNNPYVIGYSISRTPDLIVTETNFKSLAFRPDYLKQQDQSAEQAKLISVDKIKQAIQGDFWSSYIIYQKITSQDRYNEYKQYTKVYSHVEYIRAVINNTAKDMQEYKKVNTLLLQTSSKPWFYIIHEDPLEVAQKYERTCELLTAVSTPQEEKPLTDEQIEAKTDEFKKILIPMLKERINRAFEIPEQADNTN